MRIVLAFALVVVAGCTKDNPAATCTDNNTCIDPDYPFCDRDGSISGMPGTCIAPECMPGTFASCADADTALVCDQGGGNYEMATCINGCDAASGCITCAPNTETCAGSMQRTCDAQGRLTIETCALGCADGTRCTQLAPSNNLGMFYDLATPDDLTLQAGTIDLDASTFSDGINTMPLTSFDVAAPPDGAPIRVFVGKHIILGDVLVTSASAQAPSGHGVGYAAAFLATEDLDVMGRVVVESGAIDIPGCSGGSGTATSTTQASFMAGGGGGAHASAGAPGGGAPNGAMAGAAGQPSSTAMLVPLRGGCPGGGRSGAAGGAIQLASRTAIHVNGTIVADGWRMPGRGGGGGAGGGILLEAPAVVFSTDAKLLARGAGGASGDSAPTTPPDDASAPSGATCAVTDGHCGNGGAGANASLAATPGQAAVVGGLVTGQYQGGGGGGGRGVIRINTADGTVPTMNQAILAGSVSTGTVGTL